MSGFYPNAPQQVYPGNENPNYPGHPSTQIGFVFDGGAGAPNVNSFPSQNPSPYPPSPAMPMMPMPTTSAPAPYYNSNPQQNMIHQPLQYPSGDFGYPDNQANYNYNNTRDLQVQDEVKHHQPPEYYPNNDYNAYEQSGPNYGHGQGQKGGGIPGGKLGVVGGAAVAGLGTALATNLLLPKKLKKNKLVKYGLPLAGAGAGGYYLNKMNNNPKH